MDSEQRSTATELKPVEFATFILMWATHVRTGTTATTVGQCQPPTKHCLPPTVAHCAPAMLARFKLKRPCALWAECTLLASTACTAWLELLHCMPVCTDCLITWLALSDNNNNFRRTACTACLPYTACHAPFNRT